MKILSFLSIVILSLSSYAQGADSLLQGRWNLFEIIDNVSGEGITPTHKGGKDYTYYIDFNGNEVNYNLEINLCSNEIEVNKNREISFKFFSSCTEMCCDDEFSKLLTYPDCTKYYIKESKTLIMVSEDRIFYFKRQIADK